MMYDTIDAMLEALDPGDVMGIGCSTPYCDAIGGKCAVCHKIWSECGCMYNEWNCECGRRAETATIWRVAWWRAGKPWRWLCNWLAYGFFRVKLGPLN